MRTNDLVSVIIPTKNSEGTLDKCLKSIKGQTHKNIEVIVIDDFSQDGTQHTAKKYNTKLIEVRGNRAKAKNVGIGYSKGTYLCFIDSDMLLEQNIITECVKQMQDNKKLGGVLIPEVSVGQSFWVKVRDFERNFYKDTVVESARFFRKDLVEKVGGFDEDIIMFEESALPQKIQGKGYIFNERTKSKILHLEEDFSLIKWLRKKYYYGKTTSRYSQRYSQGKAQLSPLPRLKIFLANKKFYSKPLLALSVLILKVLEYISISLGSFFSYSENKRALLSSMVLSSFFILLLLYYTHGALLYGGDTVGYYSVGQALSNISPNTFVYALAIFLGAGDYYAGFYISQFISAFLTLTAVYYLAIAFFEGHVGKSQLVWLGFIAALLYLFNPTILVDTFKSFISNVSVYNAAFIVFLIEIVNFWKSTIRNEGSGRKNAIIMGLALGLSLKPFPNYIRTLTVGALVFAFFVLFRFLANNSRKFGYRSYLKDVGITALILAACVFFVGLYLIFPLISNFTSTLQFATYASQGVSNPGFYYGQFNILLQTIRLFGTWSFSNNFAPYHAIYSTAPLLVITSLLWPLLVLCIPLLASDKDKVKIIIPTVALVILSLFWAKGPNPPLGSIYYFITDKIPFGIQLLPPYFLARQLNSILYPILTAYAIVCIYLLNKKALLKKTQIEFRRKLFLSISLAFVFLLLLSVLPAFNGQLESQYYSQSVKGFIILNNYQIIKNDLISNNGSALLIPATTTYIKTAWGYQGSQSFYNAFFFPANIYTLGSFGAYSVEVPVYLYTYVNLTSPLEPSNESLLITSLSTQPKSHIGNVSVVNNSVTLNSVNGTEVSATFALSKPVNISKFIYLTLQFNITNQTQLQNLISNETFRIGVKSGNGVGWYNINYACRNCYISSIENATGISLFINQPNNLVGGFPYNTSAVSGIIIQISKSTFPINLALSHLQLYGERNFSISPNWLNLTKQYNIQYLLVDKSIINGQTQSDNYVNATIRYLEENSYLVTVYNGTNQSLYNLVK